MECDIIINEMREKVKKMKRFSSVKEIAFTFDIPVSNVYKYIEDGTLVAMKKGKCYIILTESVINIFQ